MGQQQLLIIVLSAVVVVLAITTGFRLVNAMNQSNDRDIIINQMEVVVADARRYVATPRNIGGGEGTVTGYTPIAGLMTTSRATLSVTTGSDWILLQGYGTVEGWDGSTPVQVVAQYNFTQNDWVSVTNVN